MQREFQITYSTYVIGRGYIIVIDDKDEDVSLNSKIIVDHIEYDIKGIEGMMILMTIPKRKPTIGLIVSKECYDKLKETIEIKL